MSRNPHIGKMREQEAASQELINLLSVPTTNMGFTDPAMNQFAATLSPQERGQALGQAIQGGFGWGGRLQSILESLRTQAQQSQMSNMILNPQDTPTGHAAQAQLPSILAALQRQQGANPVLQTPTIPQGQSLLGSLSTQGADMIRKSQTLNPTILKAKK